MFKKSLLFSSFLVTSSLIAALPQMNDRPFNKMEQPEDLVINNRLLLKIHGKAITVMDVVRKMDLLFYRQYPELTSSAVARYQFYISGWRTVLGMVIDDFLIMDDAKDKKVVINDGEVREELESLFGPDVVINVDKLGMTLEEAFDLLKTELTVQRMTAIMVRNRAILQVLPKNMVQRYKKMKGENPASNYWVYRILSIRGDGHERVAKEAYKLMHEQGIPFDELVSNIQAEGVELVYSDEYRQKEEVLSQNYKNVLEKLTIGVGSAPVSAQKSSRLFCLKGVEKVEPPTFKELELELKQEITQEYVARYDAEYRQKLRKNYGLTDDYLSNLMPKDLQPFAMR